MSTNSFSFMQLYSASYKGLRAVSTKSECVGFNFLQHEVAITASSHNLAASAQQIQRHSQSIQVAIEAYFFSLPLFSFVQCALLLGTNRFRKTVCWCARFRSVELSLASVPRSHPKRQATTHHEICCQNGVCLAKIFARCTQ